MSETILSNELADLAESVGTLLRTSRAAERESINAAIEAGYLLVCARNCAGYGTWLPFLARAGIPERQAQRLMQLARAFIQPDTVSALGGIKATLAALGKFRLPGPGEMVLVNNLADPCAYGFVWPSVEHDGFFNLIGVTDHLGDGVRFMCKPVAGCIVFSALWLVVPPMDEPPTFGTVREGKDLNRDLDDLLNVLLAGESDPVVAEALT